jgi:signal transduction histidine kinase
LTTRKLSFDYLTKPFSFAELSALVGALIRRCSGDRPATLVVGDLRLNPATRRAWRGDTELTLSVKVFALLELFLRHPGEVLTRIRILEHAWDFAYDGVSNVIDQYVLYLRRKIDRPVRCRATRNGPRRGYRLHDALARQRGFVADVGHELRTPLATLRAELELAARPGRSREALAAAVTAAGQETDRLIRLAEDLLLLARAEAGQLRLLLRSGPMPFPPGTTRRLAARRWRMLWPMPAGWSPTRRPRCMPFTRSSSMGWPAPFLTRC